MKRKKGLFIIILLLLLGITGCGKKEEKEKGTLVFLECDSRILPELCKNK